MQIKNAKESWAGGASEVSIRAVMEYWNGVNVRGEVVDVPCDRSTFTGRGVPVRNFSRDEINEGKVVDLDFMLQDNWDVDEFLEDDLHFPEQLVERLGLGFFVHEGEQLFNFLLQADLFFFGFWFLLVLFDFGSGGLDHAAEVDFIDPDSPYFPSLYPLLDELSLPEFFRVNREQFHERSKVVDGQLFSQGIAF